MVSLGSVCESATVQTVKLPVDMFAAGFGGFETPLGLVRSYKEVIQRWTIST